MLLPLLRNIKAVYPLREHTVSHNGQLYLLLKHHNKIYGMKFKIPNNDNDKI